MKIWKLQFMKEVVRDTINSSGQKDHWILGGASLPSYKSENQIWGSSVAARLCLLRYYKLAQIPRKLDIARLRFYALEFLLCWPEVMFLLLFTSRRVCLLGKDDFLPVF